jgi:hypothetical protein
MSSDLAWVAQTGCWWEKLPQTIYELDTMAEQARHLGIATSLFTSENIRTNPDCGDPRTYLGEDGQWAKQQVSALPRLASAPTLGTSELSAATGGTVKVTFDITGPLSDVAEVVLAITSDEGDPFPTTAGLARISSPMQTHNAVDIPVSAHTPPGGYHLWLTLLAASPAKSRSTYYVDVKANTEYYTCSQYVGRRVSMDNPTFFEVPRLEIR